MPIMLMVLVICVQTFEIQCSSLEAEKAVQHHGLQEEGCLAPLLSEVATVQSGAPCNEQCLSPRRGAGERCSRQSCALANTIKMAG